jgi:hypothetical protein
VIIVNSLSLNAVALAGIEVITIVISRVVYFRVPLEELSRGDVVVGDEGLAAILRGYQMVFLAGSNGAVGNGTSSLQICYFIVLPDV